MPTHVPRKRAERAEYYHSAEQSGFAPKAFQEMCKVSFSETTLIEAAVPHYVPFVHPPRLTATQISVEKGKLISQLHAIFLTGDICSTLVFSCTTTWYT